MHDTHSCHMRIPDTRTSHTRTSDTRTLDTRLGAPVYELHAPPPLLLFCWQSLDILVLGRDAPLSIQRVGGRWRRRRRFLVRSSLRGCRHAVALYGLGLAALDTRTRACVCVCVCVRARARVYLYVFYAYTYKCAAD